jgi:hypothetical protein
VREAVSLGARRIEVAHSQYYGWALKNRAALRRSGRRSPKYCTVSSRNRPLTGARIETRARPLARLSEALDRHRGKGQQQITVTHVTVNADQAVVADTVVGGSKGPVEISNDGNNAPLLLEARHAPGLALQGAFEKDREAMPVTRG